MIENLLPAIIAGVSAAAVGIIGSILAYALGKQQIRSRLAELKESGIQSRETAERQYQLEAMKDLRQAVGGPKSQIIEALQALTAYLHRILETRRWDQLLDTRDDRPTVWLLVRPLAWAEILQRRMVYVDRMLERGLVEDEHRFMGYCLMFERSLTETDMLPIQSEAPIHGPPAHIRYGTLSALVDDVIRGDPDAVISHVDFLQSPPPAVSEIEMLLRCTVGAGALSDYCRARLIVIYGAANLFLSHFRFPYAWFESPEASLRYVDRLEDAGRAADIQVRLAEWLRRAEEALEARAAAAPIS